MEHRIFDTSFGSVYPHYRAKVERKGRSREELDEVIRWHTGYDAAALARICADGTTFRAFFAQAPALNLARHKVTGSICGVKVQEVADPLMREIRILDKLVDELAKGRPMAKILRPAEG